MPPAAPPLHGTLSHRQILLVYSGLALGMLLAALDQTIVATALPTIVGDVGGLQHLSWVVTAYLLASTASTPLYGKVSDLLGRKRVFQTAIVVFLVGSTLSGLAQTMVQLIAFRAVQGLGAGGLIVLAQAIIGDILAPRERGRCQGYLGAVFALSSVAGPLIGGFFVDNLSWRWVFYVNLPIGLAALVVTSIVLDLPVTRIERRIDWSGAALLVAAVTTSLLVTTWGGTQYAWGSTTILGLAAAAVVLTALFVLRERRAPEPVMPPHLFANRVFLVAALTMLLVGIGMFGAIVFLPLFLQLVIGVSATNSGLLLVPLMLGIVLTSVVTGRVISRTGRYRRFPIAGTAVLTVGFLLLAQMGTGTTLVTASVFMVVVGLGLGMVMQVLVLAVQNSVAHRDLGTATSATSFFRSLGGSLGVAIFGAILSSRLAVEITRHVPRSAGPIDPETLQNSPAAILRLPEPVRNGVVEAFAASLHLVFLGAVPFAAAAFLATLFLQERPLRRSPGLAEERSGAAGEGAPEPALVGD